MARKSMWDSRGYLIMNNLEENTHDILDEIPSDSESVDDIFSDSEELESGASVTEPVAVIEETGIEGCGVETSVDVDDSEDDNPLSVRLSDMDGIWEKKRRSFDTGVFVKDHGPNVPETLESPSDTFLYLLTEDMLEHLLYHTNLYATQLGKQFEPATLNEIKVFLAINILMGVVRRPSYRDYWSSNPQLRDSFIASLMPVNRFGWFLTNLHLNNNVLQPKSGEPNYDKLYKLRPLLETLSRTYREYYNPGQYQSVDESMIKFKGRSSIKQYMPQKPIKRGYKVWVRADETGFVCQFQIYTGKIENTRELNLGKRVVEDLTKELVGGNHKVFFDNFFTSVDLMIALKQKNIYGCGTVRRGRVGLPKEEKADSKMKRGEFESRTSYAGVSWLKWKDRKCIQFLSNFHDPSVVSTVSRKEKTGTVCEITCPQLVKDYNKHMGYVDKADMLKSLYEIDRKCRKWWHRIFWHFCDVTVTNAYILYSIRSEGAKLSLKNFRLAVVDGLVGATLPSPRGRKTLPKPVSYFKPSVPYEKRFDKVAHMPVRGSSRRCAQCSTKAQPHRSKWACST